VDLQLSDIDYKNYRVWLHSPSVFGSETETILAFKIGREINAIPSRVLKALRGQPEVDPDLMARVEAFVARDENLYFVEDGDRRRVEVVKKSQAAE
jgi:hypothetical protein